MRDSGSPDRRTGSAVPSGRRGRDGRWVPFLFSWILWTGVWILIRGSVTPVGLLVALIAGGIAHLGARALFGPTDLHLRVRDVPLFLLRVLLLAGIFVRELALSNLAQLRIVFGPRIATSPSWIEYESSLRTEAGRATLAALVSMTPGTLTSEVRGSVLSVHLLDSADPGRESERLRDRLERPLLNVERLLTSGEDGDRFPGEEDRNA